MAADKRSQKVSFPSSQEIQNTNTAFMLAMNNDGQQQIHVHQQTPFVTMNNESKNNQKNSQELQNILPSPLDTSQINNDSFRGMVPSPQNNCQPTATHSPIHTSQQHFHTSINYKILNHGVSDGNKTNMDQYQQQSGVRQKYHNNHVMMPDTHNLQGQGIYDTRNNNSYFGSFQGGVSVQSSGQIYPMHPNVFDDPNVMNHSSPSPMSQVTSMSPSTDNVKYDSDSISHDRIMTNQNFMNFFGSKGIPIYNSMTENQFVRDSHNSSQNGICDEFDQSGSQALTQTTVNSSTTGSDHISSKITSQTLSSSSSANPSKTSDEQGNSEEGNNVLVTKLVRKRNPKARGPKKKPAITKNKSNVSTGKSRMLSEISEISNNLKKFWEQMIDHRTCADIHVFRDIPDYMFKKLDDIDSKQTIFKKKCLMSRKDLNKDNSFWTSMKTECQLAMNSCNEMHMLVKTMPYENDWMPTIDASIEFLAALRKQINECEQHISTLEGSNDPGHEHPNEDFKHLSDNHSQKKGRRKNKDANREMKKIKSGEKKKAASEEMKKITSGEKEKVASGEEEKIINKNEDLKTMSENNMDKESISDVNLTSIGKKRKRKLNKSDNVDVIYYAHPKDLKETKSHKTKIIKDFGDISHVETQVDYDLSTATPSSKLKRNSIVGPLSTQNDDSMSQGIRTAPSFELNLRSKAMKLRKVTIKDPDPDRISNPLLELPQFPMNSKGSLPSQIPLDSLPQVGEIWNLANLFFPYPDTYPISYLGRILGYDFPQSTSKVGNNLSIDDIDNLRLLRDVSPEEKYRSGKFYQRVMQNRKLTALDCNLMRGQAVKVRNSNRSLEHGSTIEEEMDFIDPMWKSIIKSYGEHTEEDLKAATLLHNVEIISEKCLSFAREQIILGEDIHFRTACVGDEKILMNLMKTIKDSKIDEYPNEFSFSQILKSPSHFIILATSDVHGFLGFIHYSFCWFKVEQNDSKVGDAASEGSFGVHSSAKNLKANIAMELILHLDSLHVRTDHGINESSEGVKPVSKVSTSLILTGLALDHAQRLDVWYGVLETSNTMVKFYEKYFRMSDLEFENRKEHITNLARLVCDLKKCNYKYAFRMFKRENLVIRKEQQEQYIPIKERLLVHILFPERRRRVLHTENYQNVQCQMENDALKFAKKPEVIFKNPKIGKIKDIIVRLTLPARKAHNLESRSEPIDLEKAPLSIKCNNEHEEVHCDEENDINWELLKNFPINDPVSLKIGNDVDLTEDDSVNTEMMKVRNELKEIENESEIKIKHLMKCAFNERLLFEKNIAEKTQVEESLILKEYTSLTERQREIDRAWQTQLEQDMDAVCDICQDGEVTPGNQILFCEACNVAVHQKCYFIDEVPLGDWFCHPCRYFGRDKEALSASSKHAVKTRSSPSPLPICCELCPRKQGAFVKSYLKKKTNKEPNPPKWVHSLCAKWQGLNYTDTESPDTVEDITDIKIMFRSREIQCCLCEGMRGAYIKCQLENCEKWMHVTCARSSGLCNVFHGENHAGFIEEKAWTLTCPDHSSFDSDYSPSGCLSLEQLVLAAKDFPPEPKPEPLPKPFPEMNFRERKKHLNNPDYEQNFLEHLMNTNESLHCDVCDLVDELSGQSRSSNPLLKCDACGIVAHKFCLLSGFFEENKNDAIIMTCGSCKYVKKQKEEGYPLLESPFCHMCNYRRGSLMKARAQVLNKKYWKDREIEFKQSYFGKQIWCHNICAMWCPKVHIIDDDNTDGENKVAECTNIIMSQGFSHIDGKSMCNLCGKKNKMKMPCTTNGCGHFKFHVTCARQAGLEVTLKEVTNQLCCFKHVSSDHVFRARLEDMIEPEKQRAGNDLAKIKGPMDFACAAKIFNMGLRVMRCLGWAWRWAEWWVEHGDNWEPLLEEGQIEENMTDEELRKVPSTVDDRREAARKCRLAAFGAALRNRDYDQEGGDDKVALNRALCAILNIPSLVGPLSKAEKDFFAEWLARVYRSKSPELGFGEDKIPVEEFFDLEEPACTFYKNGSPKYCLKDRPIPGKQHLPKGVLFETVSDVDDYDDISPVTTPDESTIPKKKTI